MSQSGPGSREVAYRVFAAEFESATIAHRESDEELAPNYVISPTGGRLNRIFAIGVLTQTAEVGGGQIRARINDLTGSFVTYAGQYQPEAMAFLDGVTPPAFLALSGKARTFEPEDGDRVFSSVRPESVNEVDTATRDRWVVRTAEHTIERIGSMAAARRSGLEGEPLKQALIEAGLSESLASGTAIASDRYEPTSDYLEALRSRAIQALELVVGERDELDELGLKPGDGEDDRSALDSLASIELAGDGAADSPSLEREPPVADTAPSAGEPDPEMLAADDGDEASTTPVATEPETSSPVGGDGDSMGSPEAAEPAASVDSGEQPGSTDPAPPSPPVETESGDAAVPVDGAATEADHEEESTEAIGESTTAAEAEPIEDFEPGEFDIPAEERQEVSEEFGTDFETASEFDPDEGEPIAAGDPGEPASSPEPDPGETTDAEADEADQPAAATDQPLDELVLGLIEELDSGDGAPRAELLERLEEDHGISEAAVQEAIEEALMNGSCYEPADGKLKAI
jgi:RPA family protein